MTAPWPGIEMRRCTIATQVIAQSTCRSFVITRTT
jgi:hypothetical protein